MWVRPATGRTSKTVFAFQFTHPCGCDPVRPSASGQYARFNSRTRVGATVRLQIIGADRDVSIHAPVWVRRSDTVMRAIMRRFNSRTRVGATCHSGQAGQTELVSIHAPVWVRPDYYGISFIHDAFQFTHPCGCDVKFRHIGARASGFNSRTRVGATRRRRNPWKSLWFQFTHPCGCDEIVRRPDRLFRRFNSRTRVGATSRGRTVGCLPPVSIHAPVWVRRVMSWM